MGAVNSIVQGVSDAVTSVGRAVTSSPLAQAAITVGGAAMGVPPAVTAAALGVNQAANTGNIGAGLTTGLLSYGAGSLANNWLNPNTAAATAATGNMTPAQIEAMTNQAGYGATALGGGANAYPWSSMFSGLGDTIGTMADNIGTGISGLATDIGSGFSGLSSGLGQGFSNLGNLITSQGALSTAATTAGAALNAEAAKQAAQAQADAQIKAAQIAADAAKFKPVGVTTGFGSSQFGFDANGNLTSAGYNLTPQMQAQRDALLASSNGLLGQFTGSQAATAPMQQAAQQAMALGNQYLATSPEAQAQKYYQDQMALLEPGRANDLAQLQAQMQAQGRGGFAIGGGVGGQGAANPQLQALYNAQLQQNNQFAANATQGGMDYAKFGAGLVGTGGDLLSSMYGTQTAAFNPYKTALGGAQTVEGLGQNALTLGMDMGKTATTASANAGQLLGQGMSNAASTIGSTAQQVGSNWGNLLQGVGTNMANQQAQANQAAALNQLLSQWGK